MPVSDDDRRFRTCCCHVRTCTIVIAVLEVLSVIGILISAIQGTIVIWGYYYFNITSFVAWCIVVPLLIYGVLKESPTCIIPHIVLQILAIIGAIIVAIVLIVLGALMPSEGEHGRYKEVTNMAKTVLIVLGVAVLIYGLVEIYCVHVIIQCYRYLKEKLG